MRRFTVIFASIGVLALMAMLGTSMLMAQSRFHNLVWEAEAAQNLSGKVFQVRKYTNDPSGRVSGQQVLSVPKYPQGERVPKDEVVYRVRIPENGTYYLWARTFWTTGCGNSFFLRIEGYGPGDWVLGGNATYDTLHWVCLTDGGDNSTRPRPLQLRRGVVTFVLGAKESDSMVDQFVLTNDRRFNPANIYRPTPNLLVEEAR